MSKTLTGKFTETESTDLMMRSGRFKKPRLKLEDSMSLIHARLFMRPPELKDFYKVSFPDIEVSVIKAPDFGNNIFRYAHIKEKKTGMFIAIQGESKGNFDNGCAAFLLSKDHAKAIEDIERISELFAARTAGLKELSPFDEEAKDWIKEHVSALPDSPPEVIDEDYRYIVPETK